MRQSELQPPDLSRECDIVRRADLIHRSAYTFTFSPGNRSSDDVVHGPPLSVGWTGTRAKPCVHVYAKQSLYQTQSSTVCWFTKRYGVEMQRFLVVFTSVSHGIFFLFSPLKVLTIPK